MTLGENNYHGLPVRDGRFEQQCDWPYRVFTSNIQEIEHQPLLKYFSDNTDKIPIDPDGIKEWWKNGMLGIKNRFRLAIREG